MEAPSSAPPSVPETPSTEIPSAAAPPSRPKKSFKLLFPLLLLVGFLPIATGAVLLTQSLTGQAAFFARPCLRQIKTVRINPGKVTAYVGGPPVYLSALAYDKQNRPILTGVTYEWGMSSTQSIGDLIPHQQLATFKALSPGTGSIYVTGKFCNKKATGSAPVTVLPAPNLTPTPTVHPFPSRTPTPTPNLTPPPVITPTPSVAPSPQPTKRVFVTSVFYNGNLGGLAGADAKCQERADAAQLSGVWKAWLSSGTVSASSRLTHSSLPYRTLDNAIVASGWTDLTDGAIQSPIRVDEFNVLHSDSPAYARVWTNTTPAGNIASTAPSSNCVNWTSGSASSGNGISGIYTYTDTQWTQDGSSPCSVTNTNRLYCFEQ